MSQADFEYMQNEADHSLEKNVLDRKVMKKIGGNTMNLLPKNEKKVPKETPRNYVIYGGTMHGKTYFADEFPNPLNLNTDGNAEMIETPSISISNERGSDGQIARTAFAMLGSVINELGTKNHTFETIVVDVIDDIVSLFEQDVTESAGVDYIGDIGWGKGHGMLESMVRAFVMKMKGLSMKKKINVIYVSRLNTIEDNNVMKHVPSLKQKWMNIVNGNSDYTILCQKIGKNYIRRVESKRKNYSRDMVDDENIKTLLDSVVGAYDRSQKTTVVEAKKIFEQQELAADQVAEEVATPEPVAPVVPEAVAPVVETAAPEPTETVKEPIKEAITEAPPVVTPPRTAPTQPALAVETPTTRTARPAATAPRPARPPRRAR